MVESNQASGLWPQFYEPFRSFGSKLSEWFSPASEASSDEKAFRISVELPGVSEEDISLSATDDTLSITGKKSESREEKGDTWYFSERQFGSFKRTFRLPPDAEGEKSEAHMKNGVLEVTIPRKKAADRQGKTIKINRR